MQAGGFRQLGARNSDRVAETTRLVEENEGEEGAGTGRC